MCGQGEFDDAAVLGPEFQGDYYPDGYTHDVAQAFLDDLADLYEHPNAVNVCDLFTDEGWRSALEADWRLRDVDQRELSFALEPVLRLAYEDEYDHASRPPRFGIDAIYDIGAGATTRRADSNVVVGTSTDVERLGLHLSFVHDGHRWRVERVGPVSPDNQIWLVLRTEPRGSSGPCSTFVKDAAGAPFDDDERRQWCDGDGRGLLLQESDQYSLITRYPCDAGQAAILGLGDPLGRPIDPLVRRDYVRDPAGEFLRRGWINETFDDDVDPPPDAAYTGWTNGNVELWIAEDERETAIYLRRGDAFERWPRAFDHWGVIDCN